MNVLIDDANRNPKLKDWFKRINMYVRKVSCVKSFSCKPTSPLHAGPP
jgi:hypothetical protein